MINNYVNKLTHAVFNLRPLGLELWSGLATGTSQTKHSQACEVASGRCKECLICILILSLAENFTQWGRNLFSAIQ